MELIALCIALIGILAFVFIVLIAVLMIAQLVGIGSDERKRRRIVVRSTVAMGVAVVIWVFATAFCFWIFLSDGRLLRLFPSR